eukprot:TRINITY_DN216_c0_g1_i1.p1 TRINITY_DN216_c0_g1~~TRINITY_DN216_c0_g1_i1.p1  ORF type:complete len:382 (+),score=54.03 TRINITY_DN216_c0_g1_i1:492-1637(+)
MRSAAWPLYKLYRAQDSTGGALLGWCRLCGGQGTANIQLMPEGTIGNAVKHFENTANGAGTLTSRLVHSRAALLICRNPAGGNRTKRVVNGSITRFFSPDVRPHHLRFVLMLVMSYFPRALTHNPFMDDFVTGLSPSYSTPSPNTVTHHLVELYSSTLAAIWARLVKVKAQYCGLPLAHAVTDLWFEQHTQISYGSVVIRFVNPETTTMQVLHLGVGRFVGKHTNDVILSWFTARLQYYGLVIDDLGSTTTDSGSHVKKAMGRLHLPWLPCMSHSMHNSVQQALSSAGSAVPINDEQQNGHMSGSRNPSLKQLLSRARKLFGHFSHSDLSVAIFRGLDIPGDVDARGIISDVVIRWSSTFDARSRLYSSYTRMAAFSAHLT